MSISVRLDAKTEGQLRRIARQRGVSKSEVIREAIKLLANGESEKKTFRPYDALAHLIGSVQGGPQDLSEQTGQKFREILIQKHRRS